MELPKQITLMGIPIEIVVKNDMIESTSHIGIADYINQKIYIDTSAPKETVEQALVHEICHFILHYMGEDTLRDNEKFIDLMAHLCYQALTSAK